MTSDHLRPQLRLVLPAVFLLALATWGCSEDDVLTPGSTASPGSGSTEVRVIDFAFEPDALSIEPGTTVDFVHNGEEPHTVTVNGENESGDMTSGDQFSFEFDRVGEHRISCDYHPDQMQLVVNVSGIE